MLKQIKKAVSVAVLATLISPFFARPNYAYANSSPQNSPVAKNVEDLGQPQPLEDLFDQPAENSDSEIIEEFQKPAQKLFPEITPEMLPETAPEITPKTILQMSMPDIDYSPLIVGKPRVLVRDDFKDIKKYFSDSDFESIFAPRNDFYIIIHTTEQCRIERGKEICSSAPNMLNYLVGQKSTHFFIDDNCKTHAIVGVDYIANAVGESLWNGEYALNVNSINIEIYANVEYKISKTHEIPILDCQYTELGELVKYLQTIKPVPDENVLGHNQVALTYKYHSRQRKGDPGKNFDWSRIGMPNNYLLLDRDVMSGRAELTSDARTLELRALPGQLCAQHYVKKNIDIAGLYVPELANSDLSCAVSNIATVKNNF